MKKWIIMIVIVLVVFGSALGYKVLSIKRQIDTFTNAPEPQYPVTIEAANASDWVPTIDAIGFIEPLQGVTLTSQSSGEVETISFESGMKVEEGQVLLELDSKVEKANLQSAQARLPAARSKSERYASLYQRNAVSKEAYDEARAAYLSLIADIEALKANIERRTINAPFSGLVGLRNVYLGQFLQAGTEVVRLEDTSVMRLRFTVPQTDISHIKIGQLIHVHIDAYPDQKFDGKVTAIEPAVNAQSGLIQVQADIPNLDNKLRSGMFARADIVLPTLDDQITLPQTAITYTLYGDSVYVVVEGEEKEKPEDSEDENTDEDKVAETESKAEEPQLSDAEILQKNTQLMARIEQQLAAKKEAEAEKEKAESTDGEKSTDNAQDTDTAEAEEEKPLILRVEQRVVKTGERQGDRVHILEGIKPGEIVVTSGQVRLSNGVKVNVVESDATTPPTSTPML